MNQLLSRILDAHGGMDRWREYEKVEATIVSGGGFFALKGMIPDPTPRRMTAWLHEERSSVFHMGNLISVRCPRRTESPLKDWTVRWLPNDMHRGIRSPAIR